VWALKESLVAYVRRAGARVELGDGAGYVSATSEFYFPLVDADFDYVRLSGTLKFGGQVRIVAHHGLLDIGIFDPWLRLADGQGQLSVGDRRLDARADARIDLVDVALPVPTCDGSTLMWASASTELAATGSHVFEENYGVGERFAPCSVRLPWDPDGP
jgi:hypothetical protein